MQLFDPDKPENTEIEIYFKYNQLDVEDLTELFGQLDRLYKSILDYSYPVYYSEKYNLPFRNFLEVSSINTGQSIKIRFKEGWKPEFKLKGKDLEVKIPLRLGIPAIILYMLLISAQKMASLYNDTLDMQIKDLDIKIKQIELFEKMKEREGFKRPYYIKSDRREADKIMVYLLNNPRIYYFELNGLTIKDEK